jgi:hypothetical protein
VPFASYDVPAAVDILGQEKRTQPIGIGTISSTVDKPVLQMMERLNLGKAQPERKIEGVDLTPEQYHDLAVIGGKEADKRLNQLARVLAKLPDPQRKALISDTIDAAHSLARTKVMMNSLGTRNDIVREALKKSLASVPGANVP